jgi:transcriptional regulator with XRE-family HTH domain
MREEVPPPAGRKFGQTVRALRLNRQIGLREFARRVEISPTFLTQIEKDECAVPEQRAIAFARALNQDPDEFLALAGHVAPDVHEYIRMHPRALSALLRSMRQRGFPDVPVPSLNELAGPKEGMHT